MSISNPIKLLGTTIGQLLTILALFGLGFTAGSHYKDHIKNSEIIDLKQKNFKEVQQLIFEINILKLENESIKNKPQGTDEK